MISVERVGNRRNVYLAIPPLKWPLSLSPRAGQSVPWFDRSETVFACLALSLIAALIIRWGDWWRVPKAFCGTAGAFIVAALVLRTSTFVLRMSRAAIRSRWSSTSSVRLPPGATLCRVLRFLVRAKTFTLICEPAIADMQHEYNDALVRGAQWQARWIHLRGYYDVARALGVAKLGIAALVAEVVRVVCSGLQK